MEDPIAAAAAGEAPRAETAATPAEDLAKYGFERAEMGKEALAGTVSGFDRHIFLRYKSPEIWPSHLEAAESDRLPRLLAATLKARKNSIKKRTRLTICGAEDGNESSDGDVLIFPDMIRYRRLTHFDVDNFVEEVLVKEAEWLPGAAEKLTGSYVFVCAHGSRDKRCGICGPALMDKFMEEISSHGLQGQVFVSPCSHIGGHKYAGNVIIFSPDANGEVSGHWYGYVTPADVTVLIEQHIGKGKIIDHLWRGQMGLSEEDQKKAHSLRLQHQNGVTDEKTVHTILENGMTEAATGCCQGVGNSSCCQLMPRASKPEEGNCTGEPSQNIPRDKNAKESKRSTNSKGSSTRKLCAFPTWFESWEWEDTYAALAVVAAIASVAVAYSCYKQMR